VPESPRGLFITFEGPEGSGKTTQIALLAQAIQAAGREVVATREPGGVPAAEAIREMVLGSDLTPEAEALLFLAARAEHARIVIRPGLERGAVVLCDRFNDSTLAYQGYGLGLDLERLRDLCDFAAAGLRPDLTLLLDLPVEQGLARRFRTSARALEQMSLDLDVPGEQINNLDRRMLEFHRRVREGFLAEAAREPKRIAVIDAARPPKQVHQALLAEVHRRLPMLTPAASDP
jgi:dTMP kinase